MQIPNQSQYTKQEMLAGNLWAACLFKNLPPSYYFKLAEFLGVYTYRIPEEREILCASPLISHLVLGKLTSTSFFTVWQYSLYLEMLSTRAQQYLMEKLNGY